MSITVSDAIGLHLEEEHRAHACKDPSAMSTSTLAFIKALLHGGRMAGIAKSPINLLLPGTVDNFRTSLLEAGISEDYARKHIELLSGACHFAWRRGYVSEDPMQLWRARRRKRRTKATRAKSAKPISTLSGDEVSALLDNAEQRQLKVYPAMLLATGSGLRLGEIRGLRWRSVSDTDLDAHVRVLLIDENWPKNGSPGEAPKTGESRHVLYPERFREWVRGHRDLDESLVIGKSDARNLLTSLKGVGESAGIETSVSWLTLRHTFASNLLTLGYPLEWISAQMGNTPEVCRKHYATFIQPWKRPIDVPEDRNPTDLVICGEASA